MDWVDNHTAESLLMQYSEWLDVENNLPINAQDERTHEALVREFITQRNPDARPKVLYRLEAPLGDDCGS